MYSTRIKMAPTNVRKAFSLVELMVGVAILGILTGFVLNQVQKYRDRALDAALIMTVSNHHKVAMQQFIDVYTVPNSASSPFATMYGCSLAAIVAGTTSDCLSNPKPEWADKLTVTMTPEEAARQSMILLGHGKYTTLAVYSHARMRRRVAEGPITASSEDYWQQYFQNENYCKDKTVSGFAMVFIDTNAHVVPWETHNVWLGPYPMCF